MVHGELTATPSTPTAPPDSASTERGVASPADRRHRLVGVGRLVRRRVLVTIPVLIAVTLGMFAIGNASPIDPVRQYAGAAAFTATQENLDQIRHNWGLDDPAPVQYLRWLGHMVRGDLGFSTTLHQPVTKVLASRAGWTVLVVGLSLLIVLVVSLVVGTVAAYRRDGWFDRVVRAVAYGVEAMPVFWIALLAIAVFSLGLGWLPIAGVETVTSTHRSWVDVAHHLILPVGVLALSQCSWFVLFVRDSVIESLQEDHVVGAFARGLPGRVVLFGHALRTALLPFITLVGTHLPEIIGGAVLVEVVFSLPGLGAVAVEGALGADFPLLAAITLLTALLVLTANLCADVAYAVADPRVRLG